MSYLGLSIAKCEYRGKHPKPEKPQNPAKPARPANGFENGHEWVDLGLPSGTKWATMNVGANSPEESGYYFAWGETDPMSSFIWENHKHRISGDIVYGNVKFSKYVTDSKYGSVDGKKELDLSDDAARVKWGGDWRMPSASQIDELRSNCTHAWTTMNGKSGCKVTSKKNGNSIFLPTAGSLSLYWDNDDSHGFYWTRSLNLTDQRNAYGVHLFSGDFYRSTGYDRLYGFSVRPVLGSE